MKWLRPLLLFTLALSTAACADRDNSADEARDACVELRAHVVDLQLGAVGSNLPPDEMARHRDNLESAMGEGFLDQCADERTPAYLECARGSGDLEQLRRC
jgi:hypothetical protein